MTQLSFEDFYKVPEMQFDISRLREDLDRVLEKKGFDSLGLSHFGAIPVNQIPNDEESIKGHNMRVFIGQLLMRVERKWPEI